MRTKKFEKKLSLNKETVALLRGDEQKVVKGGALDPYSVGNTDCPTEGMCDTNITCRFCF